MQNSTDNSTQFQQIGINKDEELYISQAKQYQSQLESDEFEEDYQIEKSDSSHALINFLSSMLGTGVLALPFAMYQCGYVLGTIIIFILAYCSNESIRCLVEIVDHRADCIRIKSNSDFIQVNRAYNIHFPELIFEVTNKKFMIFGEVCLVVYQIGACISYIIFFSQFLEEVALNAGYKTPLYLTFTISIIILTPLVLIDNIHHLTNLGIYCLLSFIFCAGVLLYHAIILMQKPDTIIYHHRLYDFSGIGNFLGVAVFAFEGIGLVFHVRKSMKEKNDFNQVFQTCMILSTLAYAAFGIIGVIACGPKLNQIVLMNIPYDGWISAFCKVGYALGKLLCYPLVIFPCYEIIERYICGDCLSQNVSLCVPTRIYTSCKRVIQHKQNPSKFITCAFRIGLLFLLTGIACIVPQFSYFLNLLGGMTGIALQFIIPSTLYISYFFYNQENKQNNKTIHTKIYHYITIIIGTIMSFYVTYDSLTKLV